METPPNTSTSANVSSAGGITPPGSPPRPLRIDKPGAWIIAVAFCAWTVTAVAIAAQGGGWGGIAMAVFFGPVATGILAAVGGVYVIVRMLFDRDYPWAATLAVVLWSALASMAAIFLLCASMTGGKGR